MSLHIVPGVTGSTVLFRMTSQQADIRTWTMMCWAQYRSSGLAYMDLMGLRSWSAGGVPAGTGDGNVLGLSVFDNATGGASYFVNIGDTATDSPDLTRTISPSEWHHFVLTSVADPAGGGNVTMNAYVDGRLCIVDTVKLGPVILGTQYGYVLFNTRESDTDWGAVWPGDVCAFKMWNGVVLSKTEIDRERWTVSPVRRSGLYSWLPMMEVDRAGESRDGFVGQSWIVRTSGTALSTGPNPPGVTWDSPQVRRDPSAFLPPPPAPPPPFQPQYHRAPIMAQ